MDVSFQFQAAKIDFVVLLRSFIFVNWEIYCSRRITYVTVIEDVRIDGSAFWWRFCDLMGGGSGGGSVLDIEAE